MTSSNGIIYLSVMLITSITTVLHCFSDNSVSGYSNSLLIFSNGNNFICSSQNLIRIEVKQFDLVTKDVFSLANTNSLQLQYYNFRSSLTANQKKRISTV